MGGEDPPVETPDESADDSTPFTDDDFPASKESVGAQEGDTVSGVNAEEITCWRRLPEIGGDGVDLFKDIKPSDIQQGALGNCWFLAACASVASYPAWIREMFSKSPSLIQSGKYVVRLYHPGKKAFVYITVSDEVPCSDEAPSFSSLSGANEIWPCLLEKAFSKFAKSYAATEGGFPAWGMTYLCGGAGEQWENQGDGNWSRTVATWGGSDGDLIDSRDEAEQFEEKNGEGDYLQSPISGRRWSHTQQRATPCAAAQMEKSQTCKAWSRAMPTLS